MDQFTQAIVWICLTCAISAAIVLTYRYLIKRVARQQARRMTRALSISHGIFTTLERVPDSLINRDLRRGLVLLISHHLDVLRETNAQHPHLNNLQQRVARLNRIPSGLHVTKPRNKVERRQASMAFEELAKLIKDAMILGELEPRDGALGHASAVFTGQQIAVDTARQAAKDAENIRAYPQALNFAHQAQALCRKLPPLVGKALSDAVTKDIDRLENLTGRPARI